MSLNAIVQHEILRLLDNKYSMSNIELDMPNYDFGDFSSNISFKLAKKLKKAPILISSEISTIINNSNSFIQASAVAGFVNLKISDTALIEYFEHFLDSDLNCPSEQHILIEYVSANPTGPLHIGHGRWAVVGDVLTKLLKIVGYSVKSEFYINDAGNQINAFNDSVRAKKDGKEPPKNSYGGYFIDFIIDQCPHENYVDFTIEYQKETLRKLGCSFDTWFKESVLHKKSSLINRIQSEYSSLIYTKDGALWFKTTAFGDDKDRVILKEDGSCTYFAADIVYHLDKLSRGFNKLINIWGADHHGYINRIKAAIQAKNSSVEFKVILGQLVHLFNNESPVKMSKRTGELIELEEVINDIGIDAIRYFLIEKKPEQHIDFDLAFAKKKSMDNPVYYIQYAHARISRIFEKTKDLEIIEKNNSILESERKLILYGARYYDVLYDAAATLEPYKLTHYLFELSKLFHSFYQQCSVIQDQLVIKHRLTIITTVQKIIQHCSKILGISTPNKM